MEFKISVIIPVYNEVNVIESLLIHLQKQMQQGSIYEVLVVDGGSIDGIKRHIEMYDVKFIKATRKGRAVQMNQGAAVATGTVLYFLHADSIPVKETCEAIKESIAGGDIAGSSVVVFDNNHWTFRWSTRMSRMKTVAARFGDQGLFILKDTFKEIGGFDESLLLFEDQEIFRRISLVGTFAILPTKITTSARRFEEKGIYKVHAVYYILNMLYQCGVSQKKLFKFYKLVL